MQKKEIIKGTSNVLSRFTELLSKKSKEKPTEKNDSSYRFQVNLGGMIEILSDHLYSDPDVFLRELLQNGYDAISARKNEEPDFTEGEIIVEIQEEKELRFTDNGCGLTEDEVHRFLAIIGESSKKSADDVIETDYIGRFGIGLLSCFMVSDRITVLTKSSKASDSKTIKWVGAPDGTYTIEETDIKMNAGTTMVLTPKKGMEDYFTKEEVTDILTYYGALLPVPITIVQNEKKDTINPVYLPWDGDTPTKEKLLFFGEYIFGEQFLDCCLLHSETGDLEGVAYIVPYRITATSKHYHRIFLKNMLLTQKGDDLLPGWAVFVKCIINTKKLRPTASRESFYKDQALLQAKTDIENCLVSYVHDLAKSDNAIFHQLMELNELALKSLALEHRQLCECLIDHFHFKTTKGIISGRELRTCTKTFVYAISQQAYNCLAQLYIPQGKLLIAAYHVYDVELLSALAYLYDLSMQEAGSNDCMGFMNSLSIEERNNSFDFCQKASAILKKYHCSCQVKNFSPATMPAFYNRDELADWNRTFEKTKDVANPLFQDMLGAFAEETKELSHTTLFFNMQNPIVKKLVGTTQEDIASFVEILYVQALLASGYQLRDEEMNLMNQNILQIMELVL